MTSIGSYLKQIREEKKIDIEYLSTKTRLSVSILKDIENDKIGQNEDEGYSNLFILSYARAIGADTNIVQEKLDALSNRQWMPERQLISPSREKNNKILISTKAIAWTAIFIVACLLSWFTYSLYRNHQLNFSLDIFSNIFKKKESKSFVIKPRHEIQDTISNRLRDIEQISRPADKEIKIDNSCFSDTTDYVNQVIFKEKDSPLNVEVSKSLKFN